MAWPDPTICLGQFLDETQRLGNMWLQPQRMFLQTQMLECMT